MEKFTKKFEQFVSYVLIGAVIIYIGFQIIVLVRESFIAYAERIKADSFQYTSLYGKNAFIVFFNILLALEVLETVKVFNKSHDIKLRIILIVCMIAVSRKLLAMEIEIKGALGEFAVAALVICLSASYFFVIKANKENPALKTADTANAEQTKAKNNLLKHDA